MLVSIEVHSEFFQVTGSDMFSTLLARYESRTFTQSVSSSSADKSSMARSTNFSRSAYSFSTFDQIRAPLVSTDL